MSVANKMSFLDHLEELRWRLLKSIIAVIVCSIGFYFISERIITFLVQPLPHKELIFLGPTEAFMIRLKASLLGGIIAALPVIFFQMWKFIAPGLYEKEKKYLIGFVFFATIFFLSGIAFVYYVILPVGLDFLMKFQTEVLKPQLAVGHYFSFVFRMFIAFGVVFEMPLLSFFLTKIGLINDKILSNGRRYAYVSIFIIAALLTPPDVFTQTLMAIPLVLLYEVSILVSKIFSKK